VTQIGVIAFDVYFGLWRYDRS